ncbi:2Fe-2S iron-sulfur cluster-binding protein [Lutibacter sp. A80]|uniref:2Fe-2S iron-sulfur cluster-binding protein n=1 Tax=Lutibacter sp. A80 TaxID=2918453 RepID=UPI001F067B82|nr:2Fe-2S iron-sulfur cluster-binding protein [Lutibacter sp. A80]UMB59781.1 2Fe-2S iron-sulfur cluster-binding protein [Lutibacter sp. A80]
MSKFYTLTIKEIKKETKNAVSIVFDIPTELKNEFTFTAGQYLNIKKELNGEELRRAYSICSAPNSNELRVAVKAVDNGTFSVFSNTILKEGDTLDVQKPEGKFILKTSKSNTKNYLAIAAGSGITPIMAMLKAVLTEEPNSTFTLIYGNKTVTETIFKTEIDNLHNSFPDRLNLQYVYSQEEQENSLFGRIDKGNINYIVKNKLKNTTFNNAFLCGPEAMIQVATDTLIENNIDKNNIHFELFSTPTTSEEKVSKNIEGTSEITIIVDDEETTFNMDAKTTILNAALEQGLDAPYSCQGGICSSCLGKVTKGTAKMAKNSILSDSEIEEGLILTCQAHPTSQKITVDYDDV